MNCNESRLSKNGWRDIDEKNKANGFIIGAYLRVRVSAQVLLDLCPLVVNER